MTPEDERNIKACEIASGPMGEIVKRIYDGLTEAHNAGMEEAAKVADKRDHDSLCKRFPKHKACDGIQCRGKWGTGAAIREKINPAEREDAIKKFPNGNKYKDLHDGEA